MLTEGAVRASDRRAQFVGLDNYVEAGGEVLRDLFQTDDGGWLQDAALLETMVTERLNEEAEAIRAEGWHWIEVGTDFPYGHTYDLRRIRGETEPMSEEEEKTYESLKAEYDTLEDEYAEADELPEEVDERLGEIETAMEVLQTRPIRFGAEDYAIAGAFVSIDGSGGLRVERGYVRPEDEPAVEAEDSPDGAAIDPDSDNVVSDASDPMTDQDEEEDGTKPLSDRLICELTVHRTMALRDALANDPQLAMLACLHAMVLQLFYHYGQDSCIEISPRSTQFGSQVPNLGDRRASHLARSADGSKGSARSQPQGDGKSARQRCQDRNTVGHPRRRRRPGDHALAREGTCGSTDCRSAVRQSSRGVRSADRSAPSLCRHRQ